MLKKSNRINKTRDLKRVYRLGKAVHTSALVIKFVPAEKTRVAFVVSKKVSKLAVERNRIKRALREEIRLKLNSIPRGEYMISVKGGADKFTNQQLRFDLTKSIAKIPLKGASK